MLSLQGHLIFILIMKSLKLLGCLTFRCLNFSSVNIILIQVRNNKKSYRIKITKFEYSNRNVPFFSRNAGGIFNSSSKKRNKKNHVDVCLYFEEKYSFLKKTR